MKEFKVYVVSSMDDELDKLTNISGDEIEDWNNEPNLPEDAIKFIEIAKKNGLVYSLQGFQDAFNFEEISTSSHYIFITNKY